MSHEARPDLQDSRRNEPGPAPTRSTPDAGSSDLPTIDGDLLEEELLVEEVSIDGMCGVY